MAGATDARGVRVGALQFRLDRRGRHRHAAFGAISSHGSRGVVVAKKTEGGKGDGGLRVVVAELTRRPVRAHHLLDYRQNRHAEGS